MGMLPAGRGKVLMKNCQDIAKHANEMTKKIIVSWMICLRRCTCIVGGTSGWVAMAATPLPCSALFHHNYLKFICVL